MVITVAVLTPWFLFLCGIFWMCECSLLCILMICAILFLMLWCELLLCVISLLYVVALCQSIVWSLVRFPQCCYGVDVHLLHHVLHVCHLCWVSLLHCAYIDSSPDICQFVWILHSNKSLYLSIQFCYDKWNYLGSIHFAHLVQLCDIVQEHESIFPWFWFHRFKLFHCRKIVCCRGISSYKLCFEVRH